MIRLRRDDQANIIAFEGVLVALILLGAIFMALGSSQPATDPTGGKREFETMAQDALVVMYGLKEPRGRVLDVSLAETMDCAAGENPPASLCVGSRPNNLSHRIEGYLPPGAGYSIALDNGVDARTLYASGPRTGERLSAYHTFNPDWNLTFTTTDLSCHDPTMKVNVSLAPISRGQTPPIRSIQAEADGVAFAASDLDTPRGVWNATLPVDHVGSTIRGVAENARGSFFGTAGSDVCTLGASGWLLRDGLNQSTAWAGLDDANDVVPVGKQLQVGYDFESVLDHVPGASVTYQRATIYEPVPGRTGEPGGFVIAQTLDLVSDAEATGGGSWSVPTSSLFGVHPVVVRVGFEVPVGVDVVEVELRMLRIVEFAHPSGIVPIEAPYRAVLEVWLPDWG